MWHIVKVRRASSGRPHQGAGHPHRGFSHPVLFEALESRLSLNVAPTAGGVLALSAPESTVGTNPANFFPGSTTGSGVATQGNALDNQQVAFNTPYWVPNDRIPLTPPPSDQLPLNVNQQASTPQGIHNFSFGPDTGTHFSSPAVTLTARRPIIEDSDGNWIASNAADDTLLDDTILLATKTPASRQEEVSAVESADEVALVNGQPDRTADSSPATDSVLERSDMEAQEEPTHFQPSAVDWMMADQAEADTASSDAALVEVVRDEPAEAGPGAAPLAHGLATSLAAAGMVSVQEHVRDKTDAGCRGRSRRAIRW